MPTIKDALDIIGKLTVNKVDDEIIYVYDFKEKN